MWIENIKGDQEICEWTGKERTEQGSEIRVQNVRRGIVSRKENRK